MPDTTTPHHYTHIREFARVSLQYRTVTVYRATCSTCGWVGREFAAKRDAETDGSEHETQA